MSDDMALNSLDGSVWVFPDGPNHPGHYLGCADVDDIAEPTGDVTLTHCFTPKGEFKTVGKKRGAPGPVTTTITTLTFCQRNYLEKLKCDYGLIFLQNDGGRSDLFCNHCRATILDKCVNTSKSITGLVNREDAKDATHAFAISANNPVIEVANVKGNRKSITETHDLQDVQMLKDTCGPCAEGVAVAGATGGIYSFSQVWLTHDNGQSWVQTSTGPFFAAQDLISGVLLDYCHGSRRILVCRAPLAGAQGQVAYSDDGGANWTELNLGGATEGAGGRIFALDAQHIWIASTGGYIYFSSDGGASWTAQEAHVITNNDFILIRFAEDGLHGYVISSNGIVAKTVNGGTSWSSVFVFAGGPVLTALSVLTNDYLWMGDENGLLWYSYDGGATWTQNTGVIGVFIDAIEFVNDWVGYVVYIDSNGNTQIARTIDGGLTWNVITSDTTSGIYALSVCDVNYAVYVGGVSGTYAFAGVVEED